MKNKLVKEIIFYAASAVVFIYYIYAEFFTGNAVSAVFRAALLLVGATFATFGALTKAYALESNQASLVMKRTFFVFFVLYVAFVLNITLFDSFYGRSQQLIFSFPKGVIKRYVSQNANVVPFKTVSLYVNAYQTKNVTIGEFVTNIFGNLAAFMPFGLFLPLYFSKTRKFSNFAAAMFFIVLFVETLQLITMSGAFDVDDIILNVAGACLFFLITKTRAFGKALEKVHLK